jgi:hypothetical protein
MLITVSDDCSGRALQQSSLPSKNAFFQASALIFLDHTTNYRIPPPYTAPLGKKKNAFSPSSS